MVKLRVAISKQQWLPGMVLLSHVWCEVLISLRYPLLETGILGLFSSWSHAHNVIIYPLFWSGRPGIPQIPGDLKVLPMFLNLHRICCPPSGVHVA